MAYQSAIDLHEAGESKEASNVSRTFESLAAKIGLTPSSRRVVKPVETSDDDQDGDAFAEWLKKGRLN
jgi:phage terminase small subunit